MAEVTDDVLRILPASYSLWIALILSVGVYFLANFGIGCFRQRRRAAKSVAGIPGPPGHWLKGHLDYVSFSTL